MTQLTDQQIIDCFTKAGVWLGVSVKEVAANVAAVRLAIEADRAAGDGHAAMKLKIADNSQYTKEQLKALKPYVGRDITAGQLPALARLVPVAIVYSESDDENLAIAHPDCW